ncbi:MAG: hypothetical protein COA84_13540 [Robiginitomaculum sp.]|nr:MAG: hypothetical protein COA84_13540 [Robiginitomaculum sp.]
MNLIKLIAPQQTEDTQKLLRVIANILEVYAPNAKTTCDDQLNITINLPIYADRSEVMLELMFSHIYKYYLEDMFADEFTVKFS